MTVGDEIIRFALDPPGTERNNGQPRPVRTSKEPKILQLKLSWYQPPAEIPVSWIDSADCPLEDQLTNRKNTWLKQKTDTDWVFEYDAWTVPLAG